MRKLLCIPIVHAESDLGSLGPAISRRSASLVGEKRWAEHNEVVTKFWQSIADYLQSLDKANLKIYQDGLAADGELGRRVIEEAASRGSKNHQIILDLIRSGADIRKTEDVSLLLEEHQELVRQAQSAPTGGTMPDPARHPGRKRQLGVERDRFIADRINNTLGEGETGVLLLGAYHDVAPYLAKDIVVEWVKERAKVQAYFLEFVAGRDENRFRQLSTYMASPIGGAHSSAGAGA